MSLKTKHILTFWLVSVFFFGIYASQTQPWKTLTLKDANGNAAIACAVTDSTVLRFVGDTLVINKPNYERRLSKYDFTNFDYLAESLSSFSVSIFDAGNSKLPLPGVSVALFRTDTVDSSNVDETIPAPLLMLESDSLGTVCFENLPMGYYSVCCNDSTGVFSLDSIACLFHDYNDNASLGLRENVFSPFNIIYEYYNVSDEDTYTIELYWTMTEEELYGPFRDYLFSIYINGELIGVTSETNYIIEDLLPGEYIVEIHSTSIYGNMSEVPADTFVKIEGQTTSQIAEIDETGNDEQYEYFDLNGLKVSQPDNKPGIYIRRSASGNAVKILIPN